MKEADAYKRFIADKPSGQTGASSQFVKHIYASTPGEQPHFIFEPTVSLETAMDTTKIDIPLS